MIFTPILFERRQQAPAQKGVTEMVYGVLAKEYSAVGIHVRGNSLFRSHSGHCYKGNIIQFDN